MKQTITKCDWRKCQATSLDDSMIPLYLDWGEQIDPPSGKMESIMRDFHFCPIHAAALLRHLFVGSDHKKNHYIMGTLVEIEG